MDDARQLDERALHEKVLEHLRRLSADEAFAIAVRAGIYTQDGQLTPPYRDDGEPSKHRPRD